MAEVAFDAIQARIAALCKNVSGITTALTNYPAVPFLSAVLPVMMVRPGRVTYERVSAKSFFMLSEYGLILHITPEIEQGIPDPTREALCYPFLVSVPKYFMAHPRLDGKTLPADTPDAGLVYGSTFANANGAHRNVAYYEDGSSEVFWGPVFRLIVRTLHSAP
jgi:hypothetical protein